MENVALTLPMQGGAVEILRGVDLDVAKGESVAITGASGSGKTSLMMLLAGLEKATGGRIDVMGHALGSSSETQLAEFRRLHIGIVFQSFHLIPTMTAIENVMVPLELSGISDAEPRAREALAAVGLSHRLAHYPSQLSGGEQQRVAIARAVAPRPGIVLADEPTGNLDQATGQQITDLLFSLHRELGMTLILITHDKELAARCNRRLHMVDGRIIRQDA